VEYVMSIVSWYEDEYHTPQELVGELVWQEKYNGMTDNYPRRTRVVFQNLTLYAGDDKMYVIYVKDRDMNPVDITGATGVMTIKATKSGSVLVQKSTDTASEGQIGAANKGEMYFHIVPDDTKDLDIMQYVFDVRVTLSSGKVYTVLEGTINLKEPVNPTT
jgi:hypothetical protein